MRCWCYAKFLSGGAIPPGEFFAHIHTQWSCIEDSPKTSHRSSNQGKPCNRFLPQSIVFVADCQSVEKLTSDLATMPGAGIANVQIFPVPEV